MVLERMCTDWVADLPSWRNGGRVPGLTPDVIAEHILLPRLLAACSDLPAPGNRLGPDHERNVRELMEAERPRLEPEISTLAESIAYGLAEAGKRFVPVTACELAIRVAQAVGSLDDADPITDLELAAVVSAYLENRAVADIAG